MKNFYTSRAWRVLRAQKLSRTPLCEYCPPGTMTKATQVDHRLSIAKGGAPLDMKNLASSCASCHSKKTTWRDGGGFQSERDMGCDIHGYPLDPNHPWNLEKKAKLN